MSSPEPEPHGDMTTVLHVKPPSLDLPIKSGGCSSPSTSSLRDLSHLDLATTPPPSDSSFQQLSKSNSMRRAKRSDNNKLDLNWPPCDWNVSTEELSNITAAVTVTTRGGSKDASNHSDVTTSLPLSSSKNGSPKNVSPKNASLKNVSPKNVSLKNVSPKNVSPTNLSPSNTREETKRSDLRSKYSDPEMCKPLEVIPRQVGKVVRPNVTIKILILGNSYVGKSCFLTKLCRNQFKDRYASTIAVDFYGEAITVDDTTVALQFWDTAGQERFQSVTQSYYRDIDGVILMYDISVEESFIAVKMWINSMEENMDKLPPTILVGNKVDLDEEGKREVPTENGEMFAEVYNAHFFEASAKTGYNVTNACLTLVNKILPEAIKKHRSSPLMTMEDTTTTTNCWC